MHEAKSQRGGGGAVSMHAIHAEAEKVAQDYDNYKTMT